MQQIHNPQFFTPFMAWKVLFQHSTSLVSKSKNINSNAAMESENANGNGAIKNGGIVEGGGIRASTNTQCLLLAFNVV